MAKHIDIEHSKSILDYNHETGLFTRIAPTKGARVGDIAGVKNKKVYIKIRTNGKTILAHRLAWAMHYGYQPKQIDHINGIKNDNRISNLRECTDSENKSNKPKPKNNKSGHKGVSWCKQTGKWRAQIAKDNKYMCLGRFTRPEDAAQAYAEAAKKYHGEFMRLSA